MKMSSFSLLLLLAELELLLLNNSQTDLLMLDLMDPGSRMYTFTSIHRHKVCLSELHHNWQIGKLARPLRATLLAPSFIDNWKA